MKVRALRGVCVGPGLHLAPGDTTDLDAAQVTFLSGIGAVEVVKDPEPETQTKAPVKTGTKEK